MDRLTDIDSKLDKLLTDVSSIKVTSDYHTVELQDLKEQIKPILFHVNGVKWVLTIGGSLLGVSAAVATILALWK